MLDFLKRLFAWLLLIAIIAVLVMSVIACFADRGVFYERAIIYQPGGTVVEGEVQHLWEYGRYEYKIQIDGVEYVTHKENVLLIAK